MSFRARRQWWIATGGVVLAGYGCGSSEPTDSGDNSAVATSYMVAALDIMQRSSINRHKIVWPAFRADALARIEGARTTADTYPGLRATLTALGDRHSFFAPPGSASIVATRPGMMLPVASLGALAEPSGRTLPDRLAYVSIPSFSGGGTAATTFADQLQDVVKTLDASQPCGWIVDLRNNPGGNMWPMVAGIGPVLGAGDLGFFIDPDSVRQTWFYRDGAAGLRFSDGRESAIQRVTGSAYRLSRPAPPAAVIYSGQTASSGEAVAVAFRARPLTRSFGIPTWGLSTANAGFPLSDGGTIYLTVAVDGDRSGTLYGDSLQPDESATWSVIDPTSTGDRAAQAAATWLRAQQTCTGA